MVLCLCVGALTGCSIGPRMMAKDRLDYQTVLAESWKKQVLLNLVRIRYADAPVFLDVTSIINQYAVEANLSTEATLNNPPWWHQEFFHGGAAYADRPTVTYSPMSGEKFARGLFTPFPPATVVSLVQTGYPVDMLFRFSCSSINGLSNRSYGHATGRPAAPEFEELLAALRRIQLQDTIAMRTVKKDGKDAAVIYIGRKQLPKTQADMARVRELLDLDPSASEYSLVFGEVPAGKTELALETRSMIQLLGEIAGCIDVPDEHIASGKTYLSSEKEKGHALIQICSGTSAPSNVFAAVSYRGSWFWINDDDFESKRTLSILMLFFSLVESGGGAGAPIVTVPTR